MRYWLFEDDRLEGPFTPEELEARPRFGGKTLVHPEEKQLLVPERWVPAYDVPQLAPVLAAKERAAHGRSFMPPDPAVRDLPVLGALLEQTERLERVLVGMRRELEDHGEELEALRQDGRAKDERARQLEEALGAQRARLDLLEPLKDELSRLAAAFAASEADRSALQDRLSKLVADLEGESARTRALAAEMPERWQAAAEEASALRRALEDEKAARLDVEDSLSKQLSQAEAARTALEAELARRREADAEAQAGLWRLGRLRFTPRGLLAAALLGVILAAAALALILRRPLPPPPPAPLPAPVPAPAPEPPKPEPPAPAPKPRPKPRHKAETKEEKERRIKATILLRATGGVPSSNKKAAADGIEKLSDAGAPPPAKP